MRNLTKILLLAGLTSCEPIEFPEIDLKIAKKPNTTQVSIPDTTITQVPDTTIVQNIDTLDIVSQDTIITYVPDTVVYTPVNTDGNIFVTINYRDFIVGEVINYSFEITNLTNDDIVVENLKSNPNLVAKMYCDKEFLFEEKMREEFKMKLKKNGYLKINKNNGKVELIASGVEAEYEGKKYYLPYPLELSIKEDTKDLFFEKVGEYNGEVEVRYSKNGKNIESKFYSERFKVE